MSPAYFDRSPPKSLERDDFDSAPVEAVGWDGDALEAQAFAYLALRSLGGLPLSLPGTTGGVLHRAP
jgi:1,6-anhydro-N-acetylmuramate kinase